MGNDNKPCCPADALRRIRQITINGLPTGITMLDDSIAYVKAQVPTSDSAIREALLKRVKVYNYIPRVSRPITLMLLWRSTGNHP